MNGISESSFVNLFRQCCTLNANWWDPVRYYERGSNSLGRIFDRRTVAATWALLDHTSLSIWLQEIRSPYGEYVLWEEYGKPLPYRYDVPLRKKMRMRTYTNSQGTRVTSASFCSSKSFSFFKRVDIPSRILTFSLSLKTIRASTRWYNWTRDGTWSWVFHWKNFSDATITLPAIRIAEKIVWLSRNSVIENRGSKKYFWIRQTHS